MSSDSAETEKTAPEASVLSAPPAEAAVVAALPAEAPSARGGDDSHGGHAAGGEAHDDGAHGEGEHDGDGEGGAEAEGAEGEGAEAGEAAAPELGPDGAPVKKRRRRRRRKKAGEAVAGAPGTEGGEASAQDGAPREPREQREPREPREQRPERQRRDPSSLPFSRFVPDLANRRGLFAPGEVIAGRAIKVEGGVAVLDLFGKAYAFVALNEPREIEAALEPEPEPEEAPPSAASDPSVVAGALAQLDGHVGMPASESLPPPPPVDLDGDGVPDAPHAPDDEADPAASDPAAIARAASALRHVGTPLVDSDGDGVPDDLELAGESEGGHETSSGREEAPATIEEAEAPPIELGSVFRGRIAAVADSGHLVLFNRRVTRAEVRARLAAARAEHQRVFGVVYGWNRGGFDVLVEGLRAFCPISGLSLDHIESPEPFIGQRLEFSVQQAKSGQQGIVVSRRGILEREARRRAKELRRGLAVGQVMKGRVAAVRDFGLIVDLGGLEGLVHLSEVSWDRQKRPGDVASVGDVFDVRVIRLGGADGERGDRRRDARIGLSIKATQPNPFDAQIASIEEGTARRAKVMRVTDFGAFVELLPGVEGLLHVTELGRDVTDARQKLKDGDEIVVVIERVDAKARRVALSLLTGNDVKLFEEGQLNAASSGKALRPGAVVKVRVEKVEAFGITVQIEGIVGKRGRGFIPNIEMGTERGTDHRKKFPPGTELEVKILGVDRDGGLKCSKKALAVDEERKAVQAYRKEAAAKGLGTFGDLLKKKLAKQGFQT